MVQQLVLVRSFSVSCLFSCAAAAVSLTISSALLLIFSRSPAAAAVARRAAHISFSFSPFIISALLFSLPPQLLSGRFCFPSARGGGSISFFLEAYVPYFVDIMDLGLTISKGD